MSDIALNVLAQVAEQMGFLTPTGPGGMPPAGATAVRISFTGPASGAVAVAADRELTQALARNLLVLDPDAVVADGDAADAHAEFANVLAGNLLPALLGEGEYRLGAPEACVWPAAATAEAAVECAEGVVAVRVVRA